eukprot:scaffold6934_cov121-Isochrysis_galbana.AAC.6
MPACPPRLGLPCAARDTTRELVEWLAVVLAAPLAGCMRRAAVSAAPLSSCFVFPVSIVPDSHAPSFVVVVLVSLRAPARHLGCCRLQLQPTSPAPAHSCVTSRHRPTPYFYFYLWETHYTREGDAHQCDDLLDPPILDAIQPPSRWIY